MTWKRVVRWTDWDGKGLKHLSVADDDRRIVAESLVIGEREGHRFGLSYRLVIDPRWRVREVNLQTVNGPALQLMTDGDGRWSGADGVELAGLSGCIDVDITATPFTNTLPIRRLDLAVGEIGTIKVAYVSVPDLTVRAVDQRYTRLADKRFRYEGLSTGFSTEVEVDGDGIVGDYPGVFRLVP